MKTNILWAEAMCISEFSEWPLMRMPWFAQLTIPYYVLAIIGGVLIDKSELQSVNKSAMVRDT